MDALQQLINERNLLKAQLREKYSELNIRHEQLDALLNYITSLEHSILEADEEDKIENLLSILHQRRREHENLQLQTNWLYMEISLMN